MLKWMCLLTPWHALAPMPAGGPAAALRDAYCAKALPAAALSKLLAGPPKGLPGKGPLPLPLPGIGGPGGLIG